VKLTSYLHIVIRLRMLEAISPVPHMSSWRSA